MLSIKSALETNNPLLFLTFVFLLLRFYMSILFFHLLSCASSNEDVPNENITCTKEGDSEILFSMSSHYDSTEATWELLALSSAQIDPVLATVFFSRNGTPLQQQFSLLEVDGWNNEGKHWQTTLYTSAENEGDDDWLDIDEQIFVENQFAIEYTAYTNNELVECKLLGNDIYYYDQVSP